MVFAPISRKRILFTCNPLGIQNDTAYGERYQIVIKRGAQNRLFVVPQRVQDFKTHSHSTNPIIWGCISYTLTGITFANLLIFYLLFLAVNFLSIKIVSQKAGEYNYLLHRFPGYSAIENTLI